MILLLKNSLPTLCNVAHSLLFHSTGFLGCTLQDATKAKKEAIAMKTEYEQNMQQAKTKASDIVNEAQRTASLQSEEILKSAAQEARAMKEKAESDIAQEKRKAVNEVKNEIGGMAMEIAGKVIEREIKEEDHAKLIDEFISNVGEAS